jgi:hypothetical protein
MTLFSKGGLFAVAVLANLSSAMAGEFVVELAAPLALPTSETLKQYDVVLSETLSAGQDSYAVFTAKDVSALATFMTAANINAEKVSEVLFINSPTIGGGQPASAKPRPGHQVFVIERPIPGVGFLGLEQKQKISRASNLAVEKLGDIIEWERSYLTSEGTYCIYRADTSETLREHGALAGAPIGKITPVLQQSHPK